MSNKPKRPPSRIEIVQDYFEKKRTGGTLISKLKSKTFLGILGAISFCVSLKVFVKPWYEKRQLKKAEEFADFLWEKDYKKTVEQ